MLNVCSINSTSSVISLRITKVCRSETKASGKWAAEIKHTSKKIRLQLLVCVKSNSNDGILIFSVKLVA